MANNRGARVGGATHRLGWVIGLIAIAAWLGFTVLGGAFGGGSVGSGSGSGSGDNGSNHNGSNYNGGNASVAQSGPNAFTFTSLHTDYALTRDASRHADLAVTETFHAVFPEIDQNHGIERAIPRTADGRSLHLHVTTVTDASGTPIPYAVSTDGGFTTLRIGNPNAFVHGAQTYVVKYTMRDVIQQPLFQAKQQFAYDVNGTGWAQPFGTVSATLHVPARLAGRLSGATACYQGAQGSAEKCDISRDGDSFEASARSLGPHQNMTMVVGFTPGTFAVPISWPRLFAWILLGLAIVLLAFAIVVRIRKLGNPKGTGIIVPQYAAYPGIGVMEAAELLDERDRAFPALITELVVSRAATMTRDDRGTKKTSDDIYAVRLHDATVLDDEDAAAVHTLFGSIKQGAEVTLDPSAPTIGDRIGKLLLEARDSVRAQALIARKHTPLSTTLLVAGLIVAFLAIALLAALNAAGLSSWVHDLALVVALAFAITAVVFVWPRERRTDSSTPAYEHLLGIRDYLRLAEADRIRMLQSPQGVETVPVSAAQQGAGPGSAAPTAGPGTERIVKLYEKLLPYAILFNIEKEWRAVLGGYWATTPTDVSPTLLPLQTLIFANAFSSGRYATTASTQSASHSWSGSGGSSPFGGGFSGGGFGGGGGGGW